MKKNLFLTLALLLTVAMAPNAHAIQLQWDISAVPGATGTAFDANHVTGTFNEFGFASQTSTIQYDTDVSGGVSVNDKFDDSGNMKVTSLIAPAAIDDEGVGFGIAAPFEITAEWSDVKGHVTGVTPGVPATQIDVAYTSGTIDFYLDTTLDSSFANPALTAPPAGAGGTGFGAGPTATLIAKFSVMSGIGHTFVDLLGGIITNQGSVDLFLSADYLLPGFWLDSMGVALDTTYPLSWIFATTDMNINTPTLALGAPVGALYTAYSNQNGSGGMTVVPEPATVLLLGVGLAGLGLVSYRRKK